MTAADVDKAFATALRASEIGGPLALFTLGRFYEEGLGVAPSSEQARALYWQAAGLGLEAAAERIAALDSAVPSTADRPVRRYAPGKLDN